MAFTLPQTGAFADEAVSHLKNLIRIDTTNPPGGETAAAKYCADALAREGLEPVVLESAPGRGNVVCRLAGEGSEPPLMLISHLDVVAAHPEGWDHPPFAAEEADGFIYGRGTVDMKHMAAMSLTVMTQLKRAGFRGKRDLVISFTADEEDGGQFGAGWLVENHPDLVRTDYAVGEVGGFSIETPHGRVYPIMTAEKGVVRMKARAKGAGGHGSMPVSDNAVGKLGIAAYRLSRIRLQPRVTDAARSFVTTLAARNGGAKGAVMKLMLKPALTDLIIDNLVSDPEQKRYLGAILHNTVTPTVVRAGEKFNVIPTDVEMDLDGRYLPGCPLDEFMEEVADALGPTVELEEVWHGEPIEAPSNTPLFEAIRREVEAGDRGATVTPYLSAGFTDWKHYSKLGIRVYGYTPMRLPPGLAFASLFHGVNERILRQSYIDGTGALMRLAAGYCG